MRVSRQAHLLALSEMGLTRSARGYLEVECTWRILLGSRRLRTGG